MIFIYMTKQFLTNILRCVLNEIKIVIMKSKLKNNVIISLGEPYLQSSSS